VAGGQKHVISLKMLKRLYFLSKKSKNILHILAGQGGGGQVPPPSCPPLRMPMSQKRVLCIH